MSEVDRGRCVGFAWTGSDDVYAVLSPAYRCPPPPPEDPPGGLLGLAAGVGAGGGPAALPTRSAARLFAGTGGEGEAQHGPLIPSKLFFKRILSAAAAAAASTAASAATPTTRDRHARVADVAVDLTAARESQSGPGSACPLLAQEAFGGPLLCLTTPTRAEAARRAGLPAADAATGGQRAFSQIEADALRRQQEEAARARSKDERAADARAATQAASVAAVVAASATAWEEAVGGGSEHLRAAQKSRFYVLAALPDADAHTDAHTPPAIATGRGGRGGYALRAVGPPMLAPRQVSWDVSTGLAAVLVGNTVNVLRLEVAAATDAHSDGSRPHGGGGDDYQYHYPRTPRRAPAAALALTLSVVGAVDLAAHASGAALASARLPSLVSLHWSAGQLFAATATDVLLISTQHPYLPPTAGAAGDAAASSSFGAVDATGGHARVTAADRRKPRQQRKKGGGGGGGGGGCGQADDDPSLLALLNPWDGPRAPPLPPAAVDVVVIASTGAAPHARGSACGPAFRDGPAPRPATAGWLDVVGVSRGALALATRDGTVLMSPLARPRAACLRLLGVGRVGDALAWAAGSEACAGYFARRGLLPAALALAAGAGLDGRAVGKRDGDGGGEVGAAEVAAVVAVGAWPADLVAAARAHQALR